MCHQDTILYSCSAQCTSRNGNSGQKKMEREYCELKMVQFKDPEKYRLNPCRKIHFNTLRIKQRCPKCIKKALAERVAERKEREEKEKDAERRGERGEVLRQLRLEQDEDEGEFDLLTPKASQGQFSGSDHSIRGHDIGDEIGGHMGGFESKSTAEVEAESKAETGFEDIAAPASIFGTAATSSMSQDDIAPTSPTFQDETSETVIFKGSPKLLGETPGSLGLGIYF